MYNFIIFIIIQLFFINFNYLFSNAYRFSSLLNKHFSLIDKRLELPENTWIPKQNQIFYTLQNDEYKNITIKTFRDNNKSIISSTIEPNIYNLTTIFHMNAIFYEPSLYIISINPFINTKCKEYETITQNFLDIRYLYLNYESNRKINYDSEKKYLNKISFNSILTDNTKNVDCIKLYNNIFELYYLAYKKSIYESKDLINNFDFKNSVTDYINNIETKLFK